MLIHIVEHWKSLEPIAKAICACCLCFNVILWTALCYMFDEIEESEKGNDSVDLGKMLDNLEKRGHKVDN